MYGRAVLYERTRENRTCPYCRGWSVNESNSQIRTNTNSADQCLGVWRRRQFILQDPDGYLLRFFQDLGERKRVGRL